MKKFAIQAATMVGTYLALISMFDAPVWGAMIGGWVVWLVVRPEGWQ